MLAKTKEQAESEFTARDAAATTVALQTGQRRTTDAASDSSGASTEATSSTEARSTR